MKIYTRTGDEGETGVLGGRVSKSDIRIAAYGTVDELNAHLGLAVAEARLHEADRHDTERLETEDKVGHESLPSSRAALIALLEEIQCDLFAVGAELAALDPDRSGTRLLDDSAISRSERWIDGWDAPLPQLQQFILPGGTPLAAHLHVARTVCRRAERHVVQLRLAVPEVSARLVIYLNRIGDLLFVLARRANFDVGRAETVWRGREGVVATQPETPTDD